MIGGASATSMPIATPVDSALTFPTFDRLWADALHRHNLRLPPLKGDVSGCRSLEDAIGVLEKNEDIMRVFREKGQKVREFLKPFASFVGLFVDSGAEAAAAAGVPGGKAVFAVFGILLAATKGVSQAYDALEELLSKLQDFLGRLDAYLADPTVISPALKEILVKILGQLLEVLVICTKRFEKKVHTFRKYIPKRAEDYVEILLGKTEVQDALSKLDKLVDVEQLRLLSEVFVSAKTTGKGVEEVRKGQEKVVEDVIALREELFTNGITKWLSPPDPDSNHNNASKSRQSETDGWFFGSQFDAWMETENGVFWIHGKPGSGKSVLFSSIVDRLQSGHAPVYFYFDFRDPAKQTVRGLMLSLVYQLAARSRDCFALLKRFYEVHRASLGPPNDDKLFGCLQAMLQASGRVYILLDALDECSADTRHDELLPFLENIVALRYGELRLLVTSRPEDDVRECMSAMATKQLNLHEDVEQARTVARHVAERLAHDRDYQDWPEHLRARANEILIANAGGMFLWVDLQLRRLRRCDPAAVEDALGTLPKTLHGTYERILTEIEEDSAGLARRVFECIAFATRPLTVDEVAEVFFLQWQTNDSIFRPRSHSINNLELRLLRVCSSFIQIVDENSDQDKKRVVQFVHFSAQEYLLSASLHRSVNRYILTPTSAHTTLARLCFAALSASSSFSDQPFADYAICSWTAHVQLIGVQKAVKGLLSEFLRPHSSAFSRWLEEWNDRGRKSDFHSSWSHYDEHSTPLYVAAYLGLQDSIVTLLDTPGVIINAPNAPVIYASACSGQIETILLLLRHGADIRACTKTMATALHAAALYGHIDVARFLLKEGAVIDAREEAQTTPLHRAAERGHVDVALLLLEHGANLDARDVEGQNALHKAAQGGHVEISRLLLEHGASVNAPDREGETPLHLAVWSGQNDVLSLLLERGATVDARNILNRTPLQMAIISRRDNIVRLLLDQGAAVDGRETGVLKPLNLAILLGDKGLVCELLARGAAVNARHEHITSPLHIAAEQGHLSIVRLLLNHGAAVEPRDYYQATPMHLAARWGHASAVQYLVDCNAALDVCTGSGWSILHGAASEDHVDVIRLAVELGADTEWRNHAGQTALLCAAGSGHDDAVRALLDHGASVTACDSLGFSALDQAAAGGHAGVMRVLLERGASICTENSPHGSWTCIAERAGRIDAVRPVTRTWRQGEAQDVVQLVREHRLAIVRGDTVLRRLRRYRSVGSWGDVWTGVDEGDRTGAASSIPS